jgi:kynurenine formamidase
MSTESAMRIVDLTLLLAEELPAAWATHMPYQQKPFNYFTSRKYEFGVLSDDAGPYRTHWLLIDEHTGTHVDAPAHFIPEISTGLPHAAEAGTVTVDQIPLSQLMGAAIVIDVSHLPDAGPGVSPTIGRDLIIQWERQNGEIRAGDIVLFRSGWDRYYTVGAAGKAYCYNPLVLGSSSGWPAPDVEAMAHLIDRGVMCVGTDGPSMGSVHDGAAVHQCGLAKRVAFVEALASLDQLPPRGASFCFAPLKVARGTGAPGRAFAWTPIGVQANDRKEQLQ